MDLIRKNLNWIAGAIFLLFFILRLTTILTAVERISHPDELVAGTLALEWLQGLKFPLSIYQVDFYSGESLFSAWTALPFFKILGPTLFSLKLAKLFWSFLMLILAFFIQKHFTGKKSALILLLLLTFCPPVVTQILLLPITSHSESLFFSLITLGLFASFFKKPSSSRFLLVLFALSAGWNVWIYQAGAILTLSVLLTWAYLSPVTFFSRQFFYFSGFFLIGLAPWILDNLHHEFRQISFFKDSFPSDFTPVGFALWLRKIPEFIFWSFPSAFSTFDCFGIPSRIYSFFYGMTLYLGVGILWKNRKTSIISSKSAFKTALFFYPFLFVLIFPLSRFWIMKTTDFFEFRYLTPLIFFMLMLLSATLSYHKKGILILFALIFLGAVGQAPLLFRESFARSRHYKGYTYKLTGHRLAQNHFSDPRHFRDYRDIAAWFPIPERKYLFWGLMTESEPPDSVVKTAFLEDFPETLPELKKVYAERLGELHAGVEISPGVRENVQSVLPPTFQGYFWRGYSGALYAEQLSDPSGLLLSAVSHSDLSRTLGCIFSDPAKVPDHLKTLPSGGVLDLSEFSFGAAACSLCDGCLYQPRFAARLGSFPENSETASSEIRQASGRGLGWAIQLVYPEDPVRSADWILRLPKNIQMSAAQGAAEFRQWYEL